MRSPNSQTPRIRRKSAGRGISIALALVALMTTGVAQASNVRATEVKAGLDLVFTTTDDRSTATLLNGAGTTASGKIAIFLRSSLPYPESIAVRGVTFYVNGRRINKERYAPYDLGGTKNGANAALISKKLLRTGENRVVANVKLRSGAKFSLRGTLTKLPSSPSIVDIATSNAQFSLLVEALVTANLVGAVDGTDPITVFAPTNDAFVDLLGELGLTKEELFAETELLTEVLTYHVLAGAKFSPAVLGSQTLVSLQGERIIVDPEGPFVNDSVLGPIDIAASNGVIHVIDRVLLPPSIANPQNTIAALAAGDGRFGILLAAATEVGLDGLLSTVGPNVTLFAPTDAAFVELLGELGVSAGELLANKPLLTTVLLYHLVNAELFAEDVLGASEIVPMESEPIEVDAAAGQLDGIDIIETNLDASNGVVHVINGVLLPPAAIELLSNE